MILMTSPRQKDQIKFVNGFLIGRQNLGRRSMTSELNEEM